MSNKKPFLSFAVRATVLPALLLTSTIGFAASDAEIADLKARIAALEATPSWSSAEQQGADPLSIHGFVNVGISSANTDDIAPVSGNIGDELDYQAHQSFGLQVGYQLDEKTDIVAQMLGRGYQENFNMRMNWAYIGRSILQDKGPMADLKLRIGRAPADIYMISEYYDVGYAYPWVIPPREAYDLLGGIPYDGADLTASFNLPADWSMHLKGFIGEVDVEPQAGQVNFDLEKIRGVNVLFERDSWRVRLGYGQASVKYDQCCNETPDFDTLTGGINSLEEGLATIEAGVQEVEEGINDVNPLYTPSYANDYTATPILDTSDNLGGSFSGVGFNYDNGDWLVMGEYMMQRWDTYNPDMDLAYLTVGKRFGDWMPYVTASQAKVEDDTDGEAILDKIAEMKAALDPTGDAGAVAAGAIALATGAADQGVTDANAAIATGEAVLADYAASPSGTGVDVAGCTALGGFINDAQCLALAIGAVAQGQAGLTEAQAALAQLEELETGIADFNSNADLLSGGVSGLNLPQKTYSVGVRYDFAPGATAKLQVDKITGFEDTRGDLENAYVTHFAIQAAF